MPKEIKTKHTIKVIKDALSQQYDKTGVFEAPALANRIGGRVLLLIIA